MKLPRPDGYSRPLGMPSPPGSTVQTGTPSPETPRRLLLDRLWEQAVSGNVKDMHAVRSRLLLLLSALSILVNLIYAGFAVALQQYQSLAIYGVTLVILTGVCLSAWRQGWRRATAIIYIGSAVLSLSLFILINYEVPSVVIAWLPFIPMLAMILLDRRDGIAATLGATLWFSAMTLYVQWQASGASFAATLRDTFPTILAFAVTALAALAVLLVYVYIRDLLNDQQQREREAKEALLRILCHDISGDLSNIRMSSIISGSPAHPDRLPGAMRTIREATENIIEMVQTVRSMAALEAGKLAVRLQPVPVTEALQHALDRWQERAAQKGVSLVADVPETPLYVWADPVYLEQTVLGNLISNAIKFTPSGKHIHIAARQGNSEKDVALSIKDEGIGIPDSLMKHLFDPGKHTSREGTDGEPGTGFGLPLVKQFVQHFGGTIQVRSAGAQQGSEFLITLRRADSGDQSLPAGPR